MLKTQSAVKIVGDGETIIQCVLLNNLVIIGIEMGINTLNPAAHSFHTPKTNHGHKKKNWNLRISNWSKI